ncbi:hypothetical protein AQ490_13570 [Wenjunlia vitaminophila]|uniref:Lipoprotein n=1 Tax=Wenjunlia vitaminophila TaxID=76728 RepID=A0A0T6LXM4_WENVI|nr:hypothetical protein [Wenjunlia vitaminophila]KRV50794.1 hypothetical protein AQ490_13570 [Wenjunlia vitaminophila]
MHRKDVRRACAALAAAAALTGLAACGSDSDGKGQNPFQKTEQTTGSEAPSGKSATTMSIAALQRVEAATEDKESAKVSGSMEMGTQKMTMDGAIDWADGLLGNLTIEQQGGTAAGVGTDGKMLARYTRGAMYLNMGPTVANQIGGKSWIKYDYANLAEMNGASGAVMQDQLQSQSPTKSVKLLLASPDVKKVGTEQIGGEETTHYSGTIDVADFTEQASENVSAEELEQFRKELEQNGVTTETIDVWINDEDLMVKKVEKADTAQGKMLFTANYSEYGVDVDVEIPPASETADFRDLMQQQTG